MNNQPQKIRWWQKKDWTLKFLDDLPLIYIIVPISLIIFWILAFYFSSDWAEKYFIKWRWFIDIIGTLLILLPLTKFLFEKFEIYNWLKLIILIILIYPSWFIFWLIFAGLLIGTHSDIMPAF